MLVDINLLPQKEKRRFSLFILFALFFLIAAAGFGYLWLSYNQLAEEEKRLQAELASTQQLKEIVMQKENGNSELNAAEQLKAALDWAEGYPVPAHKLLQHLVSLLPERGFILAFSYEENGTVQLSIQFDSSRAAAFFLKELQESKLVKEAALLSIATESVSDSEENTAAGKVLPRYIAQFTIMADKPAIKAATDGEEVSG